MHGGVACITGKVAGQDDFHIGSYLLEPAHETFDPVIGTDRTFFVAQKQYRTLIIEKLGHAIGGDCPRFFIITGDKTDGFAGI